MRTETRHLAEARIGKRLDGKWYLDALLGWGGSAAVYAATHRNGKRAALKILHAHCMSDELLVSRFVREGYLANKIQHPGIVSILDDNTASDGSVYLVMELLDGSSLERHGRGLEPPLSFVDVARIGDDVLDVLVAAHAGGLVHRDIKPANLFITRRGQLKVLDFGIARIAEANIEGATQTGMMMGTPAFMPPEQARARWHEVDARSDLWALGATMMTLLLGKRPRIADTANEELLLAMTEPLPSLGLLMPDLPLEFVDVVDRAVAFDRASRWQGAREMREALRAAMTSYDMDSRQSVTVLLEHGIGAEARRLSSSSELAIVAQATVLTPHAHVSSAPGFASGHPSSPSNQVHSASPSGHSWPMRPVPEPEPAPSLTTHRAVLQSTTPRARPRFSAGRVIAAGAVVMVCAMAAGGALYLRGRKLMAESNARAPAASMTAAPESVLPPEPKATTTPLSLPTATSEPTAVPTLTTSATAARPEGKRDAKPPSKPAASTDPDKIFDRRF